MCQHKVEKKKKQQKAKKKPKKCPATQWPSRALFEALFEDLFEFGAEHALEVGVRQAEQKVGPAAPRKQRVRVERRGEAVHAAVVLRRGRAAGRNALK
jgi:hypothetical protein